MDDGPTLNADLVALCFFRGSRPVLLRNSILFVIFQRGVLTPCPPSGSAHGTELGPNYLKILSADKERVGNLGNIEYKSG